MGKQTFNRIKKALGILLVVFFITTITAASVSAAGSVKEKTSGTACGEKTSLVTGKSSVTASDPPVFSRDFDERHRNFDRDFNRDFDRDFDRHFGHFRNFDRGDFDRHFKEFHRDFDRDFHGNFDRHFKGY
jgi:hypothetical protein